MTDRGGSGSTIKIVAVVVGALVGVATLVFAVFVSPNWAEHTDMRKTLDGCKANMVMKEDYRADIQRIDARLDKIDDRMSSQHAEIMRALGRRAGGGEQ